MKLSQYAKKMGVTYKTVWRWYKAGQLDAYQTPTGMVVVREQQAEKPGTGRIALYARVSSVDQKSDLDRQMHRLRDYAAAKGYQVAKEVTEIASGMNDSRPKFLKLLADPSIGTVLVFNNDRANARISQQFQKLRAAVIHSRRNFRYLFGDLIAFGCGVIAQSVHLAVQIAFLIDRGHPRIQSNPSGSRLFRLLLTHHDHPSRRLVGVQLPCFIPAPDGFIRNAHFLCILA